MPARIHIDKERIAEFCRKWKIKELAFFGSVLREDFGPDSDVDVLVTFVPDSGNTLFDLVHMQDEISGILGRDVDLISRAGIERSHNYIRRDSILSSAEVVYAAQDLCDAQYVDEAEASSEGFVALNGLRASLSKKAP